MANSPEKPTIRKSNRNKLDEIVRAASYLFVEKGYEQTSIRDIAESVGMLKGSLYYYINSKEDILYWIIRSNHEDLYETMIRGQAAQGLSAMERVKHFVHIHTNFVLENVAKSAAFHFEFKFLKPERQDEVVMLRRRYESYLVDLLAQAQEDKAMCPDLDPALVARAILSMINSIQRWYRPESRFDATEIARHYTELSMRALTCSLGTQLPDYSPSQDSRSASNSGGHR